MISPLFSFTYLVRFSCRDFSVKCWICCKPSTILYMLSSSRQLARLDKRSYGNRCWYFLECITFIITLCALNWLRNSSLCLQRKISGQCLKFTEQLIVSLLLFFSVFQLWLIIKFRLFSTRAITRTVSTIIISG